jgi:hypothetical protein
MRPLVTIVADSLKDYGVDEVGGRCHDLLGTRLVTLPSLAFQFRLHSLTDQCRCDPYGMICNKKCVREEKI